LLEIHYDEFCESPRKNDNFGHMICWHSRYDLGDEHEYEDPADLYRHLAADSVTAEDVLDYIKSGRSENVKLQYNRSSRQWDVNVYWQGLKEWYVEQSFPAPLQASEELKDVLLEELGTRDLGELAQRNNLILPLYLYDHSGITMNTTGFSCPWDSGQVGEIYCTYADIEKEYGNRNAESIAKAEHLLQAEVREYDHYIRGDCYGYIIKDESGEEADSCWGFIGDFDKVKEWMKEQAGSEFDALFDGGDAENDDEPEWGDDD
jgi:hypothetical protein